MRWGATTINLNQKLIQAMSNQQTTTPSLTISVPLGFTAHDWAAQQCQNISDKSTKNQKYAACLAIYAMHRYFTYLSIDSNLENSFIDSHDLTLPGIGQLVCSWGDRHNSFGTLPNSKHQRIGRVALRMDGELSEIEEITELEILGFTQNLTPEISLVDLASTEVLLEHLQQLEAQAELEASSLPVKALEPNVSSLIAKILELLPWISIEQFTTKVEELVAEGKNTATNLSIWLERELQGYSLTQVKSDAHDEEQEVTAPISKEEMDAKIRELRKLSHKLVDAWK